MELLIDKNTFSLTSDGVEFCFGSTQSLEKNGELYSLEVVGEAPVPCIKKGDRLMLPIDDGIAVAAEGEYVFGDFDSKRIGGWFCTREGTMSMIIIERENKFLLISLDSGVNSEYMAEKKDGLYRPMIKCHKKTVVSYGIFNSLIEACKCYRSTKNEDFVTLSEKIKKNSEIKKLVGGGIFWIWNNEYDKVMYSEKNTDVSPVAGEDMLKIADEIHKIGVDKAMFGIFFEGDSKSSEELYKKYGYISTQYDNYNDVFNSELLSLVPDNRVNNCDYKRRRMKDYPEGVQVMADGMLRPAWAIKGFDGNMYTQNTLCPSVAAERMKEEIPVILEKYPFYKARFIDVYGGSLSECYSEKHPLTREECLTVKNGAFGSLGEMGLIAGTEDGFEGIINNLVYSEGMNSPSYFRVHDSGRKYAYIYNEEQTEQAEKYTLNPECRVPLWHLVYHECLIAFPYWGDSTESSPELVRNRILFSCLYGCPPLYSFFVKDFEKLKESIISSYKKISFVHEKVAELPITDFAVLTDDYQVQKSVFGGKYEIVANFSDKEYVYENNTILPKDILFTERKMRTV